MTKEEVLQTIKAVAKEMLDETPSHFDAEVGDEVYSDMGRVNVILEMNKKLCAAVESLPYVPGTNDGDMISRKAAIEALKEAFNPSITNFVKAKIAIDKLPSTQSEILACEEGELSAQSEQTDCEYCHEDNDGFVIPIEKNCHAAIHGSVLYLKATGWRGKAQIKYCPMCGRRLRR